MIFKKVLWELAEAHLDCFLERPKFLTTVLLLIFSVYVHTIVINAWANFYAKF